MRFWSRSRPHLAILHGTGARFRGKDQVTRRPHAACFSNLLRPGASLFLRVIRGAIQKGQLSVGAKTCSCRYWATGGRRSPAGSSGSCIPQPRRAEMCVIHSLRRPIKLIGSRQHFARAGSRPADAGLYSGRQSRDLIPFGETRFVVPLNHRVSGG